MQIPLSEHPRPQCQRDYMTLNGIWDYAIRDNKTIKYSFDGKIYVPFTPETIASGVRRTLLPEDYLHYHRLFTVENYERLFLHFDAVDQECDVYVNDTYIGSHSGGYTAFHFDITEYIHKGENHLYVIVSDFSDTSYFTRGKQKLEPSGMYYTAQSGIWQSVWIEYLPQDYIKEIKVTPYYDEQSIKLFIDSPHESIITVYHPINHVPVKKWTHLGTQMIHFEHEFYPWTPDHPYLYEMDIENEFEKIHSYFAIRKFSCKNHRFYLNNQPIYLHGLLDQGYWHESLMTPPSDQAMINDIQFVKDAGFNTIRKHVKIESMRWYYHCDRIGLIVWQDMVNGGGSYDDFFVTIRPNLFTSTQTRTPDNHKKLHRESIKGQKSFERELEEMMIQLYNTPSICLYTLFNEGWGQYDTKRLVDKMRSIDSTRAIDATSGWFDQGVGDMYSIHNYFRKLKLKPSDRVIVLSEYGGGVLKIDGHTYSDKSYGYKNLKTPEHLLKNYTKLIERDILPNIPLGLCASIYTQLSDIEEELNGLITYDREVIKIPIQQLKEINKKIYETFYKENL